MKKITALAAAGTLVLALAACTPDEQSTQYDQIEKNAQGFETYDIKNNVELRNYNRAQELYDNPSAIQWCTAFPSSNSAPIVTLPIAGKLTTSATSYFPPTNVRESSVNNLNVPARSVDGLFHGDSFYRYGFTPAGQYVDFSNSLELLCTTALTEFQRQNTFVEGVDTEANVDELQKAAEEALAAGDGQKAADILEGK